MNEMNFDGQKKTADFWRGFFYPPLFAFSYLASIIATMTAEIYIVASNALFRRGINCFIKIIESRLSNLRGKILIISMPTFIYHF